MSREVDHRNVNLNLATAARERELEAKRDEVENASGLLGVSLPPFSIDRVDPTTGSAAVISFQHQPPASGLAGMTDEAFIQRALEVVQTVGPALGLAPGQPAEFSPDRSVQQTTSGARAIHLQQEYKGIPVFQAAEAVRFGADGALSALVGRAVTIDQDLDPNPMVAVEAAVSTVAQFVATPAPDEYGLTDVFDQPAPPPAVDVSGFTPQILAEFESRRDRLTLLNPGPFEDLISASLTWFPLSEAEIRLAWEVNLTLPGYAAAFRTVIDASTGQLLYSRQLVHALQARLNVHLLHGDDTRQLVDVPLPVATYQLPAPGDLPTGFPGDWVDESTLATAGDAVIARLGETQSIYQGQRQGDVAVFNPSSPRGDEQNLLNIFFYANLMHDLFYLLGFREENGSFQGVDRLDARAYPGPVPMTASMFTPADGTSPIMKMGLVTSTNRHTALDATVVYHEYMHGVTNRLVGGPQNVQALEAPQCRGMGEGWGDYIACVLTETNAIASWSVNQPNGVRGFVYDTNFPAQTENFSRLGAGRYTVEHNIGEIWCATLLEMNRRIGMANALPLIIDALKLSPSNPSFLDMRDAILAALDFTRDAAAASSAPMTPRAYAEQRLGIWQAFARFGMGPGARCNGPFLTGIVADFNLPAGVSDLPTQPIQPSQPAAPGAIVVTSPATFQAIAIPDNNPQGIESALEVVQQGTAQAIKVSLNIIHPVPEDLVVTLRSPSGQEAILFDSGASPRPNLITTYDSGSSATLAGLTGQPIHGSWTLHVADQVRKDTGSLNSWALELTPAGSGAGSGAGLVSGDAGSAPALDTTFQITLDFPSIDAKEDFLVAFRGWFIQYQQTSTAIEALKRSSDEARRFIEEQRSGADLIHAGGIFEE